MFLILILPMFYHWLYEYLEMIVYLYCEVVIPECYIPVNLISRKDKISKYFKNIKLHKLQENEFRKDKDPVLTFSLCCFHWTGFLFIHSFPSTAKSYRMFLLANKFCSKNNNNFGQQEQLQLR